MPTCLITGASSGIGEALARQFAAGNQDLVLVARSADKLRDLAGSLAAEYGVKVQVERVDLAARGAAGKLAAKLDGKGVAVDILVNCAGILEHGLFVDLEPAEHQQIIDLNIGSLTAMLDAFLPAMVARGSGRVLNVASITAFQPMPRLAVYAASKAYVLSLSESLAEELRGTGVTVSALCPGVTATNMVSKAQQKSGGLNFPRFLIGEVEMVAREGYSACMKGEAICVPGLSNLAAAMAGRVTPKWLVRRITGLVGRHTTSS
ncbi:SDR family oxidoreductase [Parahaliea maris]|uniref:SDR family oxidoreductase n=1 Tax=Parahaliea maris TaxID=2716870 RepID=A0A5C8ZWG2_9GAMM|nr:SDR family oxidoreductase [Parahaliea maris]TXS91900.1 SDR family oxidoreductase [Parahaliea maris]